MKPRGNAGEGAPKRYPRRRVIVGGAMIALVVAGCGGPEPDPAETGHRRRG